MSTIYTLRYTHTYVLLHTQTTCRHWTQYREHPHDLARVFFRTASILVLKRLLITGGIVVLRKITIVHRGNTCVCVRAATPAGAETWTGCGTKKKPLKWTVSLRRKAEIIISQWVRRAVSRRRLSIFLQVLWYASGVGWGYHRNTNRSLRDTYLKCLQHLYTDRETDR